MPGWARWNAARASNSGVTVQAVTIPTTIRPVSSPVTSSTAWRAAAAAASAARACGKAAAPAAVSVATRPDRSISGAPRSRSSWRICALTPDWLTWTRSAARVKLASSATATKYSSCLSSITSDSSFKKNYLLDFFTTPARLGRRTGGTSGPRRGRTRPRERRIMPGHEKARQPEDLTRLFVEHARAGDAAGIASLYEADAVMAYPPGAQTTGRDAIRALWEKVWPTRHASSRNRRCPR